MSLTSVICKLLERTVREENVNHLSVNKLLSDSQFGFRKNRSKILQLLTVMNEWTEALDDCIQIDTVYLCYVYTMSPAATAVTISATVDETG